MRIPCRDNMNIIIPAYITDDSSLEIVIDQIYVAIESYYRFKNRGNFIIFTNSEEIKKAINIFNSAFEKTVKVEIIDFEKEWKSTGLEINPIRTRRNFIITKMLIPFIFKEDYLLMDWDILTTGHFDNDLIVSDKLRFFNAKFYDGLTLRKLSLYNGLKPENNLMGNFRWVNSGFVYFPAKLTKDLILEYWEKYNNIVEKQYRGVILFDTIGDELIYNLMMIDNNPNVEECIKYNLNVVSRNFYYSFNNISSMDTFGSDYPNIFNFHFAVGHVKPFNIIIDDEGRLHYNILLEAYGLDHDIIKWCFDMSQHRIGSHHYNSLIFSIIWQYYRYLIRETLGLSKEITSKRYLDFFNNYIMKK